MFAKLFEKAREQLEFSVSNTHVDTSWRRIPATNFPDCTRWHHSEVASTQITILVQYKLPVCSFPESLSIVVNMVISDVGSIKNAKL